MSAPEPLDIEHYGAIGNLRTVALVGRNGAIDWCCFPELDFPSVFAALLDPQKGGRFRVAAASAPRGEQRYLEDTNVLETVFEGDGGRLSVTDFLPLSGEIAGVGEHGGHHEIHRLLHCTEGEVEVEVEWSPRFDYARARTAIARLPGGALATSGHERMCLGGLPAGATVQVEDGDHGPVLRMSFRLAAGERAALVTRYGSEAAEASVDRSLAALDHTTAAWRGWIDRRVPKGWAGEWSRLVVRSELALKLLTHPDTGAIAAAATTSLPEVLGGVRNWDYRFCWIRDAAMTVQALLALGHRDEARNFTEWANRATRDAGELDPGLQLVFGLHGETEFPVAELDHLAGYRGSRPVRVGTGLGVKHEHDSYGELIGAAHEYVRAGGTLDPDVRAFLSDLADAGAHLWSRPDFGIWEMKSGPRHYVHSQWMLAVALDRATELADRFGLKGDVHRWASERDAIRHEVLTRGFDPEIGAFVLHSGSEELDAANLLMPVLGFLPAEDPRVQGTIDRTLERLTENGLVYRYRSDDGLPGQEGAFVACTFWLVSALALSGRTEEARRIFDGAAARANHLGLLSEEIDPRTGRFLGNFPQALSHIALINAALFLAHAEGRDVPYLPRANEMGSGKPGQDPRSVEGAAKHTNQGESMQTPIGRKRWAIAEGYIPAWSNGPEPEFTSHETACILNASDQEAQVQIMVYFTDREPAGPYRVTVPARRTKHLRFNELKDPEPIPQATPYASVIGSDVPVVVQHTRLDSRQAENALLSTIAYAAE